MIQFNNILTTYEIQMELHYYFLNYLIYDQSAISIPITLNLIYLYNRKIYIFYFNKRYINCINLSNNEIIFLLIESVWDSWSQLKCLDVMTNEMLD